MAQLLTLPYGVLVMPSASLYPSPKYCGKCGKTVWACVCPSEKTPKLPTIDDLKVEAAPLPPPPPRPMSVLDLVQEKLYPGATPASAVPCYFCADTTRPKRLVKSMTRVVDGRTLGAPVCNVCAIEYLAPQSSGHDRGT